MNAAAKATTAVIVRRMIAATPEDLFDAWLDPEALGIWMRPEGIRHTRAKLDARVGGSYEIIMQGDTQTYPHHGVYQVIDRPHRLVFTWLSPGTEGLSTSARSSVSLNLRPQSRCHERIDHLDIRLGTRRAPRLRTGPAAAMGL